MQWMPSGSTNGLKKKKQCHRAESGYPAGSSRRHDEILSSILDNTTHYPYDELMQLWSAFSLQLICLRCSMEYFNVLFFKQTLMFPRNSYF